LRGHLEASEADRAARLAVIEEQGRRLDGVEKESEGLRALLARVSQTYVCRALQRVGLWRWLAHSRSRRTP
jgi:hypothetical protein